MTPHGCSHQHGLDLPKKPSVIPGDEDAEVSDTNHGFPSSLGRAFELRQSKVQYNNLANHGPTKGAPVLRYHNTCSKEGQNVDVVRGLGWIPNGGFNDLEL
eukprot:s1020_g2.t1